MDLNLLYVPNQAIGYGRLGVKLAAELEARGVTVYDHLPQPGAETHPGRRSGVASNVCWVSVPTHATGWWEGQSPSMFTMFETTVLPESFRENLHQFDTVLVPSDQNVELFGRYHPNVRRVLLGVDPAEWHYVERTPPGMWFDFLIGGSGPRKGADLAYRAFLAAFPDSSVSADSPIPRLVMKSPKGAVFREGDGLTDRLVFEHPRVQVISGRLDAAEERALYASAHCYLQPSRGEGFGLQPLQAIAQGCPTILTDAHGHEAFAHLGYGLSSKLVPAEYFIYGEAGEWWDPDFDELVDKMRWVYDNWGQAVEDARIAAGVVAETFTWAQTADQFLDAIDLSRPFAGRGGWVDVDPLKFLVRVKRKISVNASGIAYHFEPGRDYWTLADVKRILAEGGHLTADCIVSGEGLTDEQVARLGGGDDHLYCGSCGQKYNTGVTKADEILAEMERQVAQPDADLTAWHAGAG